MPSHSIRTKVLPGGRIEVRSPEHIEGQEISSEIVIDDQPKLSFDEILKRFPRRRSFKDAAEVDRYINEGRDSWDR